MATAGPSSSSSDNSAKFTKPDAMARPSSKSLNSRGKSTDPDEVEFMLYYDPRMKDTWIKLPYNTESDLRYKTERKLMKRSPWNVAKTSKVLIHGLEQDGYANFPQVVKNAYMVNHVKYPNVIIVNWSALAAPNEVHFFEVLKRMRIVARRVADLLLWLAWAMKLDLRKNVHVVGEGVGVHIAGMVGSYVIDAGSRIGRITALDPKDAGFISYCTGNKRLEKNDADFVDVYHTEESSIGTWNMFGHVNFYINRKTAGPMESSESPNTNSIADRIFAQTIIDGPYGSNVTGKVRCLDPLYLFSKLYRINVGEFCLPGTSGWLDLTYASL